MDADTRPVQAIGRRLADSRANLAALAAQVQLQRDAITYCRDMYAGWAEGDLRLEDAQDRANAALLRARLLRREFADGRYCWFCGIDCYAGWQRCDTCLAPKHPPGHRQWWQFWRKRAEMEVRHG